MARVPRDMALAWPEDRPRREPERDDQAVALGKLIDLAGHSPGLQAPLATPGRLARAGGVPRPATRSARAPLFMALAGLLPVTLAVARYPLYLTYVFPNLAFRL